MKKTDLNQKEILSALRKFPGLSILDLSVVGRGCPDLMIGYKGKNYLFEIKNQDTKGKLNERQEEWFKAWPGQALVVYSWEEILKFLEIKYRG